MPKVFSRTVLFRLSVFWAVVFSAAFFLFDSVEAATCTASNGNWNTAGIWSCGHVPLATDDVVIPNTNRLNVTVNTAAVALTVSFTGGNRANAINISSPNSLTVTNAITINAPTGNVTKAVNVGTGTLSAGSIAIISGSAAGRISAVTLSTGTINCAGNITFSGTATAARLTFTGAGTLNIGGANGIGTGGAFTASTGTVNYNRAGIQTMGAYIYNNVVLSGSGAKTMTGATINGILSMEGTATAAGTVATYGAAATLQYKGSGAQITGIEFPATWSGTGGIKIENADGVTLNTTKNIGVRPLTIGADISNSIFNDGGFQLTGTGTLNLTSGTIKLGGAAATTFPGFTTRNIVAGTTVEYSAAVTQSVSSTPSYSNLVLSGIGQKNASGNISVGGNLTNSSVFDMATNIL